MTMDGTAGQQGQLRGSQLARTFFALQWAELRQHFRSTLRRSVQRPERLGRLEKAIVEYRRAPFATAMTITETQRFLADPAGYWRAPDAGSAQGEGLAGQHVRHALEAQACAFRGDAKGAAAAMAEALRLLQVAPPPGDQAGERHQALLSALARSFRRGQALAADRDLAAAEDAPAEAAWLTQPMLAYLHRQWAEQQRDLGQFRDALLSLERAAAIVPAEVVTLADIAIEAAATALRAEEAGDENAAALLAGVERHFLARAAEALDTHWEPVHGHWTGVVAFWRGRLALAEAGCPGFAPEPGRGAAGRAIEHLESVRDKDSTPNIVQAAESWLPDARRHLALHALRLGDAEPAAEALRHTDQPEAALSMAVGGARIDWRGAAGAFACPASPLAQELAVVASDVLATARGCAMPLSDPQRLVLEVTENLLAEDPDAKRLIGSTEPAHGDRHRLSLAALRHELRATFGLELPGVLVRSVAQQNPGDGALAVTLLENTPIAIESFRTDDRYRLRRNARSWLLSEDPIRTTEAGEDVINAREYAIWSMAQGVSRSMPQLIGIPEVQAFGPGLPTATTLLLLRLLLADRTPLIERKALREFAADVAAGRRSVLTAAAAFRTLPAVRRTLWGAKGDWSERHLPDALERELAAAIPEDIVAVTIPRQLRDAVETALQPAADVPSEVETAASPAGQPLPGAGRSKLAGPEARLRLVVRSARLRPWIAAILRQPPPNYRDSPVRRQDIPVLSMAELGKTL